MSRTHLVTGAGSGIGQVVAQRLHERGDHLVLVGRDEQRAHDLAEAFPGATTFAADLAHARAVEALDLPDRLDSVIHAAGVVELGTVAELPASAWQEQVAVNLVAPAVLTRRALPALRAASGTVVFVNSGAGQVAHPQWSAYAASKFGLRALADVVRAEEAGNGVRVTSVFPGRTATAMQRKVHDQEGKEYDASAWVQPSTVADLVVHVLDLPTDAVVPEVTVKPR